jgi:PKHD-type hydroxylase
MIIKVKYRLSSKTIGRILRLKELIEPEPAQTLVDHASGELETDAKIRRTEVRWILSDEHPFVQEELLDVVRSNQGRLGVSATLFIERGVQLATYHVGDHYGWHEDGHPGDGTRRQLSISVLLTAGFQGGQMEFRRPGAPQLRRPGDIVLFHAWETHRVAPVTQGVRDSLVVWFKTA